LLITAAISAESTEKGSFGAAAMIEADAYGTSSSIATQTRLQRPTVLSNASSYTSSELAKPRCYAALQIGALTRFPLQEHAELPVRACGAFIEYGGLRQSSDALDGGTDGRGSAFFRNHALEVRSFCPEFFRLATRPATARSMHSEVAYVYGMLL
jgi:hypothetical protein